MKIRIVIPMPNDVVLSKGTKRCIDNLIKLREDINFEVLPIHGSIISHNRNIGVEDLDFDKVLSVDNRKLFTFEDFNILLEMSEKYGLVSGWYYLGMTDYVSYWKCENGESINLKRDNEFCTGEIFTVPYFGTGFYLTDVSVYKKVLNKFNEPSYKGIKDFYYYPEKLGHQVGEDVGFCENLKLISEKIYINKNVFVEREPLPFLKTEGIKMKGTEMNVKADRLSFWQLNSVCEAISKVEELTELIPFRLSNAIDKTMRLLKPFVRAVTLKRKNLLGDFDKEIESLRAELKKKLTKENEGEVNEEMAERIKPINDKYQTQIDDYNKYLAEEESVDIYMYRTVDIDELNKIPNVLRRGLSLMIEEVEPKSVEPKENKND